LCENITGDAERTAFNGILGIVGRATSEEVIIELLKKKRLFNFVLCIRSLSTKRSLH